MLGTNDFRVKAEDETFIAAGSRCRQNLKFVDLASSFGGLRQELQQKACSTMIFPHCTNQIIDLWRSRCRRLFLNFLI